MHGSTPARQCRFEKEALALLGGETTRHLSLDAIDQGLSFRKRLPQPRGVVVGGGQDAAAIGREHRAKNPIGVALEGGERLAVAVPQPRGPVGGGGQDAAAVGREYRTIDRAGVALEDGERLAVAVPQPRRFVPGGGQDAAAVGRKRRIKDPAGVALASGVRRQTQLPSPRSSSRRIMRESNSDALVWPSRMASDLPSRSISDAHDRVKSMRPARNSDGLTAGRA